MAVASEILETLSTLSLFFMHYLTKILVCGSDGGIYPPIYAINITE